MILIPRPFSILQIQRTCIVFQVFTRHPLRRFFFNGSDVISPSCRDFSLMLPHLVLIEQAVSRLFSIRKCCGKGNCEKAAVGSRGDQVWLRYLVRGTIFEGGLSTACRTPDNKKDLKVQRIATCSVLRTLR